MRPAPLLLDENGEASIATAIMMSHHGFRRDLARFGAVLRSLGAQEGPRLEALPDEWRNFRNTLHGHHQAEDTGLFPHLRGQQEPLGPTLDRLTADHARIDPLLARGDQAFADLPRAIEDARHVIGELTALLDPHLATEEAEVIPHLRDMKAFPPPGTPEEADLYAQGFAWASHGISPQVLQQVYAMLPSIVTSRLADARSAFEERWQRVWGAVEVGASLSPIPDR